MYIYCNESPFRYRNEFIMFLNLNDRDKLVNTLFS